MPAQSIAKITDLLLNRVENLQWFYFEINLNEVENNYQRGIAPPPGSHTDLVVPILTHIAGEQPGGFRFNTSSQLLPLSSGGVATLGSVHLWSLLEYLRQNPNIMADVMRRIFDMNIVLQDNVTIESAKSSAFTGMLKVFNKSEQKRRDKKFNTVFRRDPAFRGKPDNVVALAEGDSWFCFPKIYLPGFRRLFTDPVHDIIDHLIDSPGYAVSSLAAGGDWLNNMLDEDKQEYVEGLSKLMPDVFLVSGGGNDLVTGNRIAHMVRNIPLNGPRNLFDPNDPVAGQIEQVLLPLRTLHNSHAIDTDLYKRGINLVSDDFFRFINACMVQYFALFYRLLVRTDKFKGMMILLHGYDFAIPSKSRSGWFWQWQRILNNAMDSGKWLYDSLCLRGISDPLDQRAAVYVMIYEFNEMLCKLARFNRFPNVFHIDCRGTAQSSEDWFDELHLKSKSFKQVADTYRACISKYKPAFREAARNNNTLTMSPDEKVIPVRK